MRGSNSIAAQSMPASAIEGTSVGSAKAPAVQTSRAPRGSARAARAAAPERRRRCRHRPGRRRGRGRFPRRPRRNRRPEMAAVAPAPASIATVRPRPTSRLTVSGVAATRASDPRRSFSTARRIRLILISHATKSGTQRNPARKAARHARHPGPSPWASGQARKSGQAATQVSKISPVARTREAGTQCTGRQARARASGPRIRWFQPVCRWAVPPASVVSPSRLEAPRGRRCRHGAAVAAFEGGIASSQALLAMTKGGDDRWAGNSSQGENALVDAAPLQYWGTMAGGRSAHPGPQRRAWPAFRDRRRDVAAGPAQRL